MESTRLQYHISFASRIYPGLHVPAPGSPGHMPQAVDGWEMLSVDLIIERLVWVCPPPPLNSLPRGNHFAAVMALLINHHKLRPQLYSCVERFSCVLWRWNPGLSGLPRSEPHSHPSMINGLLGYTNTLIIHVWKNTDRMTNICVN